MKSYPFQIIKTPFGWSLLSVLFIDLTKKVEACSIGIINVIRLMNTDEKVCLV